MTSSKSQPPTMCSPPFWTCQTNTPLPTWPLQKAQFSWSFPEPAVAPDHLLLSNEVFDDFASPSAVVECLDIASFMPGGWSEFDTNVSDHRPVVLQMQVTPLDVESLQPQATARKHHRCPRTRCRYAPGLQPLPCPGDGSALKQ